MEGRLKVVNQKEEFKTAIKYLKNSETAREVIRYVRFHRKAIRVGSYDPKLPSYYSHDQQYRHEAKTVSWNAYLGQENTNGSKFSPAFVLIHELVHAYMHLKGQSDLSKDDQYETKNERVVIEHYEKKIAEELNTGEGSRTDHNGTTF